MEISVNTETEKLEELKQAISIIENAIRRRENAINSGREKTVAATAEEYKREVVQEKAPELKEQIQQEVKKPSLEIQKIEEPNSQMELNLTKPISYSQVIQTQQEQKPKPMLSNREERGNTPDIDISALSMSSYGEAREGRKMDGESSESPAPSYGSSSSSSQPRGLEPRGIEPRGFEPRINPGNNKSVVKDIISSIRSQRPGQPIQVTDVIGRTRGRNISEQETRNLISQLQKEGSI